MALSYDPPLIQGLLGLERGFPSTKSVNGGIPSRLQPQPWAPLC